MFERIEQPSEFETDSATSELSRRQFTATVTELASLTPLAILGINNAFSHRDHSTIDAKDAVSVRAEEHEVMIKLNSALTLTPSLSDSDKISKNSLFSNHTNCWPDDDESGSESI